MSLGSSHEPLCNRSDDSADSGHNRHPDPEAALALVRKLKQLLYVITQPGHLVLKVSADGLFLSLVAGLPGKTPDELMSAIYEGVVSAYASHQLPRGEIRLSAISPYAIGQYLQFHMIAVMYLADMLHVDAFDQPNVEDYKKFTREILERT
jgi:hypothetical protein